MGMLPWDWLSLLLCLVLCCIFSRLITVMGIGKHRRKEGKEGSPPCLWKEIPSILLGDPCLLLELRLCCSQHWLRESWRNIGFAWKRLNQEQFPRAVPALHRVHVGIEAFVHMGKVCYPVRVKSV